MKIKDIIVVGFALFAMFFGAGNLIFPPLLGLQAGDAWIQGGLGFLTTGIGLPLIGIIAASKAGGSLEDVGKNVGRTFGRVFAVVIMLSIGPLFAIPRTAATTFEIGVEPFLPISSKLIVSIVSIVFFGIVVFFSINRSEVIDKVGKILTPVLLIALIIIIFKGIFSPIGEPITTGIEGAFGKGFTEGYNTMDALASLVFAGIVVKYFVDKGYTDIKSQVNLTVKAGIVSAIGFVIIYGGLTYLGATVSGIYESDVSQTTLTIGIVRNLMGTTGQSILSVAVALACLTTAIGLTATCGDYFSSLTKGKIGYKSMVVGMSIFSCVVSIFGVKTIVDIAKPILVLLYPVATILMILTIFDKYIKNKNIYKGGIIGVIVISLFEALTVMGLPIESINNLIKQIPLSSYSLAWIIPSIIGMLISLLFKYEKGTE